MTTPDKDNRPYRCALKLSEQGEVQCLYYLWYQDPEYGAEDVVLHDGAGHLLFTRDPGRLPLLIPFGVEELARLGPPRDEPITELSIPWMVRELKGWKDESPGGKQCSDLAILFDFLSVVDEDDELGFDAILGKAFNYMFDNYDQYDPAEYRKAGGDPEALLKAFYGTLGLILSRARIIG